MSDMLKKLIIDSLGKNSLTIPELIEEIIGGGSEHNVSLTVRSMLQNGELILEADERLYIPVEGKTVLGTLNENGDWEPMVSVPMSEYQDLIEIKAMYEDLCK